MLHCFAMQQPVVELLAKQSVARLHAMQQDIRAQIQDLQLQAHWIERALAEKGEVAPTPAAAVQAPTAFSVTRTSSPRRSKPKRGGTSEAIRRVLEGEPGRLWQPAEVAERVHALGIGSSSPAIRVALRRMGDEGFLTRGPDGTGWKLASANGSYTSEPSTDAPSVGLGGMDGATSWPPDDRSGAQTAPNQSG